MAREVDVLVDRFQQEALFALAQIVVRGLVERGDPLVGTRRRPVSLELRVVQQDLVRLRVRVDVGGSRIFAAGRRELWYICVSRSSAMLPVSFSMRVRRLRKKAWAKIAGTDKAMPTSVTTRACEMPSASLAGLGAPPSPSTLKLLIMP